jgi:hypothetical protein
MIAENIMNAPHGGDRKSEQIKSTDVLFIFKEQAVKQFGATPKPIAQAPGPVTPIVNSLLTTAWLEQRVCTRKSCFWFKWKSKKDTQRVISGRLYAWL